MNLGQSIRNGVKWLAFGKIGNRLFEFAFGIALARLLVPADFGMIATIQIFTGFVGMFVAGGMGQSLIRAKTVDSGDFTAVFTLQSAIAVLVYLCFFFGAPLIAWFFEDPLYVSLVRVSALTFLLRPLVALRNAWLNREMDFKSRTIVDVTTSLVGGCLSVAMALLGMGVWSLTISGLLGALFNYAWLVRVTPLRLTLNLDRSAMRRHAGYGAKLVGLDFMNYLRNQSKSLLMSKLAGPTFLGLFNKAESLSRLPNQLLMSPTMEPLFRAMSKVLHDLDQTKYLFYRAITLVMAYTAPAYVLLWWIAQPFIDFVYGPSWTEAGSPMSILAIAGVFLNITLPCSVLLTVSDRVGQEIRAMAVNLPVMACATVIGFRWGLQGVAWAVVLSQSVYAIQLYRLVLGVLPTRSIDLLRSVTPGLLLAALLFGFLYLVDHFVAPWRTGLPAAYVAAMTLLAVLFGSLAFLFLPLRALDSESARWRALIANRLRVRR